ncbi:hypothetical protein NNJEOMEG_00773 [Fundidesulfovibrio magnetotacticus]|uniref:Glycosyltransferase 2-like domain-containing protein n=1 Tax=Fundidesulfovibrio magnetotacticus TaxID=2730080 RepID=A0A6V8LXD7_9BACT|nr:glycosyltransferase [Fundidesulfovibrio magnetotacticus]GFK92945.1 hypothetical protein NNJEOMEG_00773 [Fundidesulfovibrio magnetotacticus]
MSAPDPSAFWRSMPPEVRTGLLAASCGQRRLGGLARQALSRPESARLGLDLALAAWEEAPLDGAAAGFVLDLDARIPFLAPHLRALAGSVRRAWGQPPAGDPLAALAGRGLVLDLLKGLRGRLRAEPGNLLWRRNLLELAFSLGRLDAAEEALHAPWPPGLDQLSARCAADLAFLRGDHARAAGLYRPALALRASRVRLGRCLLAQGLREEALAQWRKVLAQAPWRASLALALHDVREGLDLPGEPPPGRTAVCLYTCNKAPEADRALASAADSLPDGACLLALDNGGTDETPGVFRAWAERLGERMEAVRLPVNVGAPAARNWLAALSAARGFEFTAYLDDDARLPADWAGHMGRAVRAYPDAGVWGCKVCDRDFLPRVQNADHHLEESPDPEGGFASPCADDPDFGQFDSLRPCVSVTGCFHLLRTELLREQGGFDIRFSPTQYDDLDHDLRLAARGLPPVYNGHLRVAHAGLSGRSPTRAYQGLSRGNLLKLKAKHPPEAREALRREDADRALADLEAKLARLALGNRLTD